MDTKIIRQHSTTEHALTVEAGGRVTTIKIDRFGGIDFGVQPLEHEGVDVPAATIAKAVQSALNSPEVMRWIEER